MSSTCWRVIGFPALGAPAAVAVACVAGLPVAAVVVEPAGAPCLKIADTILPKMLMCTSRNSPIPGSRMEHGASLHPYQGQRLHPFLIGVLDQLIDETG